VQLQKSISYLTVRLWYGTVCEW